MAKREHERWRGWREVQPAAPVKGDQPTKRPGTRRRKKAKLYPWFWVRSKRLTKCDGCEHELQPGVVVAFARPRKVLCKVCIADSAWRSEPVSITTSRASTLLGVLALLCLLPGRRLLQRHERHRRSLRALPRGWAQGRRATRQRHDAAAESAPRCRHR